MRQILDRDLETNPYSKDEERVVQFLAERGIGGGDDPIGFILSSYEYMNYNLRKHAIQHIMEF